MMPIIGEKDRGMLLLVNEMVIPIFNRSAEKENMEEQKWVEKKRKDDPENILTRTGIYIYNYFTTDIEGSTMTW